MRQILIFGLCMILSLFTVSAMSGGEQVGDRQIYETAKAILDAPYLIQSGTNHYEGFYNLTNKLGTDLDDLHVAFVFDEQLSSSEICVMSYEYYNDTYNPVCTSIKDTFTYQEHDGRHYYYRTDSFSLSAHDSLEVRFGFSYEYEPDTGKYDVILCQGTLACLLDSELPDTWVLDPFTGTTESQFLITAFARSCVNDLCLVDDFENGNASMIDRTYIDNPATIYGLYEGDFQLRAGSNRAAYTFTNYSIDPAYMTTYVIDYNSREDQGSNGLNIKINAIDAGISYSGGCSLNIDYDNNYFILYCRDPDNNIILNSGIQAVTFNNNALYRTVIKLTQAYINVTVYDSTYIQVLKAYESTGYDNVNLSDDRYLTLDLNDGNFTIPNIEIWSNYTSNLDENDTLKAIWTDDQTETYNITSWYNTTQRVQFNSTTFSYGCQYGGQSIRANVTSCSAVECESVFTPFVTYDADVCGAPIVISNYTMLPMNKQRIDDFTFSSTGFVIGDVFELDIPNDRELFFIIAGNLIKTTGGGSSDVWINISDEHGPIHEELIRTISSLNDEGAVSTKPIIHNFSAGFHNITISFRRTGAGDINVDDMDITIGCFETYNGYNVTHDVIEFTGQFSSGSFTPMVTFNGSRITTDLDIFIYDAHRIISTTPGDSDVRLYMNDSIRSSPITMRTMEGSDVGNAVSAWIFNQTDDFNMTVFYDIQPGKTLTINNSILWMTLNDPLKTVNSNSTSSVASDHTSNMTIDPGYRDIYNFSYTPRNGSGFFMGGSISIQTLSGAQNLTIVIDSDTPVSADCRYEKGRSYDSADEVGDIPISYLCNGTIPDTVYNISVHVNIDTGEQASLIDDMISMYDTDVLNVSILNIPPQFIDNCADTILYHTHNLSCTINASDADAVNLSISLNDTRVQYTGNNFSIDIFDDPSLSDYNLPGCWDITVNVTDSEEWDSVSFQYCINDTAPQITDVSFITGNTNATNQTIEFNVTDPENDPYNITVFWYVNQVNVENDTYIGQNISSLFNVTLGNDLFTGLDNLTAVLTTTDSILNDSSNITLTVLIAPPAPTSTALEVNQCPDTIAGQMTLWMFVLIAFALIVFGQFTTQFFTLIGGCMLIFIGFTAVGCHELMGVMIIITGFFTFFWGALKAFLNSAND